MFIKLSKGDKSIISKAGLMDLKKKRGKSAPNEEIMQGFE